MGRYLNSMSIGTLILWCYLIWYLVMATFYFDSSTKLWANSLGLSMVVGLALVLATGPLSLTRIQQQFWLVARLFMCPFLVSSFSALTKSKGFFLLVSPMAMENMVALTACLGFCSLVYASKVIAFLRA